MMVRLNSILVILVCSIRLAAQDSIAQFPPTAFFELVSKNHPVARQALLLGEQARQEIRFAKGNFDPKLEASFATKEFQDKTYFNEFEGGVSIPTRSPINPKLNFEKRTGQLLDPSEKIPGNRQIAAGFSLPLGKGLITDERRTALKQAQLMTTLLEADQVKIINKVLLESTQAYWNWYYWKQIYIVRNQGAELAREILNRTKLNFQQGEASPLDTIQASINLQTRLIEWQEAKLQFANAQLGASNFLWDDNGYPVEINETLSPNPLPISFKVNVSELSQLLDQALTNHPDLIKLITKSNQLEFERNLMREFMKPKLDLNYALLSQPGTVHRFDAKNDYKLGLDFSMPLFLRKERSKLKMVDLKLNQNLLEQQQTKRDIEYNIRKIFNEVKNSGTQLIRQEEAARSFEILLAGELLNLQNGESDLFKITLQQEKLLQIREKVYKLQADLEKQKSYLNWAAGTPGLGYFQ
jgi:outer membrane protein TolC